MAVLSLSALKSKFSNNSLPNETDFSDLIDSTYGFPTTALNFTTGLTFQAGTTGLPVQIGASTYYIPLFEEGSVYPPTPAPDQDAYTDTVRMTYPDAVLAEDFGNRCKTFIQSICGYPASDVVTAACICSDDKNAPIFPDNTFGQYPVSLQEFSGPFFAGGIGGYPFPGIVGLFAWMSHVTTTGALFIYVHPHIGITESGQVGYMKRRGQDGNLSRTCGALNAAQDRIVGPLSAVEPTFGPGQEFSEFDFQQYTLVNTLWSNNTVRSALTAAAPGIGGTYATRMKIATDAIRDAAAAAVETILPLSYNAFFQGENTYDIFVHVGTFINVDDGFGAYVDTTSFKKYNPVTQDFTDLTVDFTELL
jgi:hypothetical protein